MSRTRLRLGLPADSWLGATSRAHPEATLRATGTVAADGGDVTALAVTGDSAVIEAIRTHDDVELVEVVERRRTETVVRVTAPPPSYVAAARRAGVPVEPPVEIADGRATLVVADDRERLSALGRRLAAAGATVESAGSERTEPILTEAQRDLVSAAVAAGYYDTPRECTLTELAADRDIAKSTCSETLHRAEGRVLRRFVEKGPPYDTGDSESDSAAVTLGSSVDDRDDEREGDVPRDPEATGVAATEP